MWLLDKAREFLQRQSALERDATGAKADLELQAATAVLLIEAAYGDTEYVWREHRAIVKGLEREFGLGRREVQELLGRAAEIRPPVVALADVTQVLRDRFTREQREEVLRLLWSVIDADDTIEEWEEVFAAHVATVLGLDAAAARTARRPSPGSPG